MSDSAPKAVFLSYASQDAEAAKKICEALRSAGVEVWFDQSELRGGDSWDAKIRKQIKECALFVPVISANTNARAEGYFRLEWKLAVDRSHLMADDAHFLFPVVIDDTADATARVPDKFRDVQWTRLNVKDTPPMLAERVAKLLAGAGTEDRGQRSEDRQTGRQRRPHWTRNLGMVMGLLIGLAYALRPFWPTAKHSENKPVLAAPAAPAVVAPLSEAHQLATRARAMSLDAYSSTADDFATAEGLLKRALELDQNDASVWAVSSLFNTAIRTRGFDHAAGRREMARRDAERALKLAPDSLEAQFALGRAQRDFEPAAAEATFNKILAHDPNHPGALSQLAWLYDGNGRVDEAAALYERVAKADPAGEALTRYVEFLLFFHSGRFEDADRCIRRSIAIQPSANSLGGLAMLLLTWKGDAGEAARVLGTGVTASHNEPRTIWMTALTQLCRRAPDDVLRTVDRLADDYIQDNWFSGPKAYFAGRAHALAGRTEAARVAWESALATTNARLKNTPESGQLHLMRGELLAFLGQNDEALREARTVKELRRDGGLYWFASPALIYAVLGRSDEALPLLEQQLAAAAAGQNVGWPLTPALLKLDPLWDKLRDDARFQKLLADGEAAQLASLPPRDWPKNPELRRAVGFINGWEGTPESFGLAEDLVKGVLNRQPTDVEATIVYAVLNNVYLNRGFDLTDDRYLLASRYAERALQLAPDDPEALAAMGQFLTFRAADYARAETLLRRAIALAPQEARYRRALGYNVLLFNQPTEGVRMVQETARLFPNDPLAQYEVALSCRVTGDLALMEQSLDRCLALAPVGSAMIWKGWLACWEHGDLPGFKTWLERIPGNFRLNDRTVFMRYLYSRLSGDPDDGLQAVRGMAGTWMHDFYFVGPRSLLLADLLAQQGKADLAHDEYERALAEIARRKLADPNDLTARPAEFWTLLCLSRLPEARTVNQLLVSAQPRPYRPIYMIWWHSLIPTQLILGERATALALLREAVESRPVRAQLRIAFRIDPRMAPFRDDPEIKALLAEPAAGK